MGTSEAVKNSLLTTLGKLRKDAKELAEIEKSDNDAKRQINNPLWINYGKTTEPYEIPFGALIKEKDLATHATAKAQEFRSQGIPYCVLDLFSPLSSWLSKLQKRRNDGGFPVDGGVANTLNDPRRSESEIKSDELKSLYCIEGDISQSATRKKLKGIMEKLEIDQEGFGLIVARPYGGIRISEGEEEYIPLYYVLLQKSWDMLSKHEGEIFCPVPPSLSKSPLLHKWAKLMQDKVGANIKFSPLETNMKITKHPNSKSRLPGISSLSPVPSGF